MQRHRAGESVTHARLRREVLLELAELPLVCVGLGWRIAPDRDLGPFVGEAGIPCAESDHAGHYAMRLPVWKKPKELAVHVTAPGLDVASPSVQAGIYTAAITPNGLAFAVLALRAWQRRVGRARVAT